MTADTTPDKPIDIRTTDLPPAAASALSGTRANMDSATVAAAPRSNAAVSAALSPRARTGKYAAASA